MSLIFGQGMIHNLVIQGVKAHYLMRAIALGLSNIYFLASQNVAVH
ncbi:hypothetical protein [Nostoc sp. ATCC 53789]|nr:hypothetical protein [Nostoc sp. ATCC 53789]